MLIYNKTDLLNVTKGIIAHGCNCQGVMGAGIAKAIRNRWPHVYNEYRNFCFSYKHPYDVLEKVCFVYAEADIIVANCFTQLRYGSRGRYASLSAVYTSLREVLEFAKYNNINRIYIPKIGAGLGGLNWKKEVKPAILDLVHRYPQVNIEVRYL